MEPWLREAIKKVIAFQKLELNWDGQGSSAPGRYVRQAAIELLRSVPGFFSAPRIVPVSGGGFHMEWTMGDRELEISVEPNCLIEALRVENGMPIDTESSDELAELFGWLAA